MALSFIDTEAAAVGRVGASLPETGFILWSTDKLRWHLSRGGDDVTSGSGTPVAPAGLLVASDLSWSDYTSLRKRDGIRPDGFLRLKTHEIVAEWGLDDEQPRVSCGILADIFRRAVALSGAIFDRGLPKENGGDPFSGASLAQSMTKIVENAGHTGVDSRRKPNLAAALGNAFQPGARAGGPASARDAVFFRGSALETLRGLLSRPVPTGDWRAVSPLPANVLDEIEKAGVPALLKLRWTPKEKDAGAGGGASSFLGWTTLKDSVRSWATVEEARVIGKFADYEISAAFVCERWADPGLTPLLLEPIDSFASFTHLSWTADLVAQCALSALLRAPNAPYSPSPLAVWLAAVDRLSCMRLAAAFQDAGFPVLSTYMGGVRVCVAPERANEAILIGWRLGLTPPLSLALQARDKLAADGAPWRLSGDRLNDEAWGGPATALVYSGWRATGNRASLWAADSCLDMPPGEAEATLADLLTS